MIQEPVYYVTHSQIQAYNAEVARVNEQNKRTNERFTALVHELADRVANGERVIERQENTIKRLIERSRLLTEANRTIEEQRKEIEALKARVAGLKHSFWAYGASPSKLAESLFVGSRGFGKTETLRREVQNVIERHTDVAIDYEGKGIVIVKKEEDPVKATYIGAGPTIKEALAALDAAQTKPQDREVKITVNPPDPATLDSIVRRGRSDLFGGLGRFNPRWSR